VRQSQFLRGGIPNPLDSNRRDHQEAATLARSQRRRSFSGIAMERFVALSIVLAIPACAAAGAQATQTRLSTESRDQNGRTQSALSITVSGDDGVPASGTVTIEDEGKPLAGASLKTDGTAQLSIGLLPGVHALRAVYWGDKVHQASISDLTALSAQATSTPGFGVSVNPGSLTLTAGQTGNATATVTPVNASALTAPMFVTLSCSGMPDQSSCTFTPENVEILPNATAPILSSMVITTQAPGTRGLVVPPAHAGSTPVAWAVILPGSLSLAGLAFAVRRPALPDTTISIMGRLTTCQHRRGPTRS
jgi:hypothetical protein